MKVFFLLSMLFILAFTAQAQTAVDTGSPTQERTAPQLKVKVFPNPATSVVNVLGLKNTSKADISITDIYGNIVLEHQWEIRRNAINIPISTLSSGAYVIVILSKEQQVRTKFYKQ